MRAITSNMFENKLCTSRIICMCTLKASQLQWWLSLNSIQHLVNVPEMWSQDVTNDILVIFREVPPPLLSFYEMPTSPSSALLAADGGYCYECLSLNFPHEQPLVRSCSACLSHCSMLLKFLMQRRRQWDICSYETNVPVEFPVMHLSSSGNHLDPWSVIYFRSEPFLSASQVKYFPPNVNMLPTAISICHIRITCTGEWVTLMFTHAASVCVCSIAEGCTLKLVLAMRGGPINTRRGKEEIRGLYTDMVDVCGYRSAVQYSLKTCCSKEPIGCSVVLLPAGYKKSSIKQNTPDSRPP